MPRNFSIEIQTHLLELLLVPLYFELIGLKQFP